VLAVVVSTIGYRKAAFADEFLASDLYDYCVDESSQARQAACKFFILGIVQGMRSQLGPNGTFVKSHAICAPEDETTDELRLMVIRLLKSDFDHFPEDRKLGAGASVGGILFNQYPCKLR